MPNGIEAYRTLNYCDKFTAEGLDPILGVNSVAPWQWYCKSCSKSEGGETTMYIQNNRGGDGAEVSQGIIYCLATHCFRNNRFAKPSDVTLTK